ncbi:MAG: metal-sulfur cluster assembly factor [Terriglobales bacterium]
MSTKSIARYLFLAGVTVVVGALIWLMASSRAIQSEYHWSNSRAQTGALEPLNPDYIRKLLTRVEDSELGINIVDLGLIYDVKVPSSNAVDVTMTLTTPSCPFGKQIIEDVRNALMSDPAIRDASLHLIFDPPWSWERVPKQVRERLLQRMLDAEKNSSGKQS